jgi:hypothetical protein
LLLGRAFFIPDLVNFPLSTVSECAAQAESENVAGRSSQYIRAANYAAGERDEWLWFMMVP